MLIFSRSSRLCVRKRSQKPSRSTEAGSVTSEKVPLTGRENTFAVTEAVLYRAGDGQGRPTQGGKEGRRAYPAIYHVGQGIYPTCFSLPGSSFSLPGSSFSLPG